MCIVGRCFEVTNHFLMLFWLIMIVTILSENWYSEELFYMCSILTKESACRKISFGDLFI